MELRKWQEARYDEFKNIKPKRCLIVAYPGSGKTKLSFAILNYLKNDIGEIDICLWVCHTEHLKYQCHDAAKEWKMEFLPEARANKKIGEYDGFVITYQQLIKQADSWNWFCGQHRVIVVLDEPHHLSDQKTWGRDAEYAFEKAEYILGLSGTPWRTDEERIPLFDYDTDEKGFKIIPTLKPYTYADALEDKILKTMHFINMESEIVLNGEKIASRLNGAEDWSTRFRLLATDIHRNYVNTGILEYLNLGNEKLNEIRKDMPDAAGIIYVANQYCARMFEENKKIHEILEERPTVVYSDEPESRERIKRFTHGNSRWIVSVMMISEGVDIPRLSVVLYLTIESTELILHQRWNRATRIIKGLLENNEAYIYIPNVEEITFVAEKIKEEIEHYIREKLRIYKEEIAVGHKPFEINGEILSTYEDSHITDGFRWSIEDSNLAQDISKDEGLPIDKVLRIIKRIGPQVKDKENIEKKELSIYEHQKHLGLKEEDMKTVLVGYKSKNGGNAGDIKKEINIKLKRIFGSKKTCDIDGEIKRIKWLQKEIDKYA